MELTEKQSELIQEIREKGLVWLVNTAILHPRGFALAVSYDDSDTEFVNPVGLMIVGDGSEPWVFGENPDGTWESDKPYESYKISEAQRESDWSDKLQKGAKYDGLNK